MRVVGTSNIYEYAYVRSVDAANSQITINKNTSVTTGQQLENSQPLVLNFYQILSNWCDR